MKKRLDVTLVELAMVRSRSQAESYIKLGKVTVNGQVVSKPGFLVDTNEPDALKVNVAEQFVNRAALKLASVADGLNLNFRDKTVLDVGSSTGGFTEYALSRGASKVLAVDIGTDQLHPTLRLNPKIELHEKTDIRDFKTKDKIDVVVIDVSFVSLRDILPAVYKLSSSKTVIAAMVKPQFEAFKSDIKHHGVIKNDKMRRQVLKDFETWSRAQFVIENKLDSAVSGAKGNQERFYVLKKVR
jgi:23S rRNA (cytidine1920-2'-O)/16S rRNA (cytidine1409-2'-O)-methyltransferase